MWSETIVPIIDGIEAAPENPSIYGCAEVMELVVTVAQAFTSMPADGITLRWRERFGHQHIIIDGYNVIRDALKQRWKCIGCQRHVRCMDLPVGGSGNHLIFFFHKICDGCVFVKLNAK